jgi:hypothetical protein
MMAVSLFSSCNAEIEQQIQKWPRTCRPGICFALGDDPEILFKKV